MVDIGILYKVNKSDGRGEILSNFQDRFTVISIFSLDASLIVGVDRFESVDPRVEANLNAGYRY